MEYIYGALLLHKLKKHVTSENLQKVIAAAGAEIDESKVKTLVASLHGINIDAELEKAAAFSTAPAVQQASEAKKEEKKEEKPVESAAGLSALFG